LARGGPAVLAGRLSRRCTFVLAYHNVIPHGAPQEGDRSLHLPQQRFAEQLDVLQESCEIVPLESILQATGCASSRPRVAITFDDAYQGAVTAGVEELACRGLPASIFVAPGLLGGHSFWWDLFAESAGPAATFQDRALNLLRGDGRAVREWSGRSGFRESDVSPHTRSATAEHLGSAIRHGNITLGSHSWTHPNLTCLAEPELKYQLERPLSWLRANFEAVIPWLSYPYGLHSSKIERAVSAAGYEAALRVEGGRFPRAPDNTFALPRINIPSGLSRDGFVLRTAGVFR